MLQICDFADVLKDDIKELEQHHKQIHYFGEIDKKTIDRYWQELLKVCSHLIDIAQSYTLRKPLYQLKYEIEKEKDYSRVLKVYNENKRQIDSLFGANTVLYVHPYVRMKGTVKIDEVEHDGHMILYPDLLWCITVPVDENVYAKINHFSMYDSHTVDIFASFIKVDPRTCKVVITNESRRKYDESNELIYLDDLELIYSSKIIVPDIDKDVLRYSAIYKDGGTEMQIWDTSTSNWELVRSYILDEHNQNIKTELLKSTIKRYAIDDKTKSSWLKLLVNVATGIIKEDTETIHKSGVFGCNINAEEFATRLKKWLKEKGPNYYRDFCTVKRWLEEHSYDSLGRFEKLFGGKRSVTLEKGSVSVTYSLVDETSDDKQVTITLHNWTEEQNQFELKSSEAIYTPLTTEHVVENNEYRGVTVNLKSLKTNDICMYIHNGTEDMSAETPTGKVLIPIKNTNADEYENDTANNGVIIYDAEEVVDYYVKQQKLDECNIILPEKIILNDVSQIEELKDKITSWCAQKLLQKQTRQYNEQQEPDNITGLNL